MSRFHDPVIGNSELRYPTDKCILASLALGLGVDAYCAAYFETPAAARRAQQLIINCLMIVHNHYELLVWAFSRRQMVDMDVFASKYPKAAYAAWKQAVINLEKIGLEPGQQSFLLDCLRKRTQTLQCMWSKPNEHQVVSEILGITRLPPQGWRTYCAVIAAAARAGQLILEGDNPVQ